MGDFLTRIFVPPFPPPPASLIHCEDGKVRGEEKEKGKEKVPSAVEEQRRWMDEVGRGRFFPGRSVCLRINGDGGR